MISKFRSRIEAQLAYQLNLRTQELWRQKGEKKLPFVTISREYGCPSYLVAEALQDKLNKITGEKYPWAVFGKEVINKIADEHNLSEALANSLDKNQRSQMHQYMDHISMILLHCLQYVKDLQTYILSCYVLYMKLQIQYT